MLAHARTRATRFFAAAVATILLLAAGCAQPSTQATPVAPVPPGWTLTFDDEFDGPAGSAPNPLRWLHDVGGTGWGNHELEYYTEGKANTHLDGQGQLVIAAHRNRSGLSCWYGTCAYTSGKLTTRQPQLAMFSQGYGHFEARIKAPTGQGLWPAFWLVGEDITYAGTRKAGEIDVMEILGDKPGQVEQHAHGPGLDFGGPFTLPSRQSAADWHTYAVDWTPARINWLVDGRVTQSMTKKQAGTGWVFNHPFYILLNLAVGGDWPGNPNGTTKFPATMLVDYVRVYTPQNS
ncbi:MAG: glycoside hydrolase family 16 protein [Pseudonocardiaceae bacterium]